MLFGTTNGLMISSKAISIFVLKFSFSSSFLIYILALCGINSPFDWTTEVRNCYPKYRLLYYGRKICPRHQFGFLLSHCMYHQLSIVIYHSLSNIKLSMKRSTLRCAISFSSQFASLKNQLYEERAFFPFATFGHSITQVGNGLGFIAHA